MSPLIVVVATLRETLKPLAALAIGGAVLTALAGHADASSSTQHQAASADVATAAATGPIPSADRGLATSALPRGGVTTTTLVFKPDLLPASAFGDRDDSER